MRFSVVNKRYKCEFALDYRCEGNGSLHGDGVRHGYFEKCVTSFDENVKESRGFRVPTRASDEIASTPQQISSLNVLDFAKCDQIPTKMWFFEVVCHRVR